MKAKSKIALLSLIAVMGIGVLNGFAASTKAATSVVSDSHLFYFVCESDALSVHVAVKEKCINVSFDSDTGDIVITINLKSCLKAILGGKANPGGNTPTSVTIRPGDKVPALIIFTESDGSEFKGRGAVKTGGVFLTEPGDGIGVDLVLSDGTKGNYNPGLGGYEVVLTAR